MEAESFAPVGRRLTCCGGVGGVPIRYPAAMSVAGHFQEVERDLAERNREHR
jgi:hypothetical protein